MQSKVHYPEPITYMNSLKNASSSRPAILSPKDAFYYYLLLLILCSIIDGSTSNVSAAVIVLLMTVKN
jgi:hypothetical protein